MDSKKEHSYPSSSCPSDNQSSVPMPPPYTDEPPAYTPMAAPYASNHTDAYKSPAYMEQPGVTNVCQPSAPQLLSYPHQSNNETITNQQTSHQPAIIIHQTNHPVMVSPPRSTLGGHHNDFLHLSPSHIVETTATGRRRTQSHVTDFGTGKEYIIKERTSRLGTRTKTVIKEVGGPRTIVKETPRRTIVKQRK
uniref:Uncharacterized protein n=1 Tax=Arion vulgaris TaxID=1028688 RepID=A0A0B6ZF97_9EUPU